MNQNSNEEDYTDPTPSLYSRIHAKTNELFNEAFLKYIISVFCYIIFFIIVAFLFEKTLPYLLPFWIALVIAILLQPLIKLTVEKLKWKQNHITGFLLVLVILLIIAILVWVIFQIVSDIAQMVTNIRTTNFSEWLTKVETELEKIPFFNNKNLNIPDLIQKYKSQMLSVLNKNKGLATTALSSFLSSLNQVPLYVMAIVSVFFGAYYFSLDLHRIQSLPGLIFKKSTLEKVDSVEKESFKIISRYLAVFIRAAFISMVVSYGIFIVFGVQYSFILALLVGIFELIPVVGPWLVYVPLALHFALYGNWFMVAVMVGSIILLYVIDHFTKSKDNVLSKSMKIHPLTMLAITFWSLQAKSPSLLIFLTLMIVGYKILLVTGIIASPFGKENDMDGSDPENGKSGDKEDSIATNIENTFLTIPDASQTSDKDG